MLCSLCGKIKEDHMCTPCAHTSQRGFTTVVVTVAEKREHEMGRACAENYGN